MSILTVPGTYLELLAAQTAVQTGPTKVVAMSCARWSIVLTSSAALTQTGTITFEGSLDGTNWYTLATAITNATGLTGGATTLHVANTSGVNAQHIRCSIVTGAITGGTLTVRAMPAH